MALQLIREPWRPSLYSRNCICAVSAISRRLRMNLLLATETSLAWEVRFTQLDLQLTQNLWNRGRQFPIPVDEERQTDESCALRCFSQPLIPNGISHHDYASKES